jgi:ATP-dependent helicase HrpA
LKMHYWLEDHGDCLEQSHSLEALQEKFGNKANQHFEEQVQHDETLTQSGLTNWDFGDWKSTVVLQQKGTAQQGQVIHSYPALVDYEDSVAIELYETLSDAQFYHATGIARLIYLQLSKTIKYLRKNMPKIDQSSLMYSAIASKAELIEDLILASIFDCFLNAQLPDSDQSFADCLSQNQNQFIDHANKLAELTHQVLTQYRTAMSAIATSKLPVNHRSDMSEQCENLVYDGFLRDLSISNLSRLPAYFQAIQKRIANFKQGSTRIEESHLLVRKFWGEYCLLSETGSLLNQADTTKLDQLRWIIEEFRMASFAQPMKTKMPVSEKKVQALISSIQRA